jgi:ubiquinone/menaquinone biosynthesis C-methylase UbiE
MNTQIPTTPAATPTTRNAKSKGSIRRRLISQFSRPEGWLGHLAGFILANRKSNRERNRWTVDLLDIQPGDRVLELGFGPGVSIATASALASKGLVVGIDHSETMLLVASRRNSNGIREGRVLLLEAPLESLPDFKESFDKVFAVNAVQFAADPLAVLRSVHQRLRRGGLIAITQQSRKPNATDRDSIQAAERTACLLEQAGFVSTRIETLPLEPACAACVLAIRG